MRAKRRAPALSAVAFPFGMQAERRAFAKVALRTNPAVCTNAGAQACRTAYLSLSVLANACSFAIQTLTLALPMLAVTRHFCEKGA